MVIQMNKLIGNTPMIKNINITNKLRRNIKDNTILRYYPFS